VACAAQVFDFGNFTGGCFNDGPCDAFGKPRITITRNNEVGEGQQRIACKDGSGAAEKCVRGGQTTAQRGVVYDVVVQQCGRVQQLDGTGQPQVAPWCSECRFPRPESHSLWAGWRPDIPEVLA
jgi:hypothetical protein